MRLVMVGLVACASSATTSPTTIGNTPSEPTAPVMIATTLYPSGLLVAAIDQQGAHELGRIEGVDQFGWLDAHTVIGLDDMANDDVALTITRTVDGVLAETIEIRKSDWEGGAALYVSRARREVWVGRCVDFTDEGMDCVRSEYLRVSPAPRIRSAKAPPSDVSTATSYIGRVPWPLPPTTAAPPGVKLSKLAQTAKADWGGEREIDVVACDRGAARARYPEVDDWDVSHGFRVEGVRWISTHPPLFEIHAALISPVDTEDDQRLYLRPCDDRPLDNYAWLGGDLWAEYHDARSENNQHSRLGSWTIFDGTRQLGTVPGMDALRVNRFE